MAMKTLPSPEELHKYLSYDPATGELTWLARTPDMFEDGKHSASHTCAIWNSRLAGRPALSAKKAGYKAGRIHNIDVYAHRVAYALMTGAWPPAHTDHINGDRTDNRWSNLRAVSHADNFKNMPRMSHNTSGFCGVTWQARRNRWVAQIGLNSRIINLGSFASKDDAIEARKRANIKYGFTERHGT